MRKQILWLMSFGALAACGGNGDPGADASATGTGPGKPASRAEAVVRTLDYDSEELAQIEWRYVDGVALRAGDSAAVLLTPEPVDACTRLAVVARDSADFGAFASEETPALVVVRDEEYPQGSVQLIGPGSVTYLAQAVPTLQTDGERFIAEGEQPGSEPFADKPALQYDVDLPFASMAEFDPLESDAGPEAGWLRGLARQADEDPEATVAATFFEDESDWNSYGSRTTWSDVLASWDDFNVVAAASGPDCATLVVEAPGFAGGKRRAVLRARGTGQQRKVFAAESSEDYGSEGQYFIGRVEHPALGAFPILDARAETVPGTGTVVIFSDGPIGDATWEQLVQKQRAVRAVAGTSFGDSYMLGSLEFAGPGAAAETVEARTISNAYLDEDSIGGLINQGEPGEPRIVANFQLPLRGEATTP